MGVLDPIHLVGRQCGEYPLVQDTVSSQVTPSQSRRHHSSKGRRPSMEIIAVVAPPLGYVGSEGRVVGDHVVLMASAVAAPWMDLEVLCWLGDSPSDWAGSSGASGGKGGYPSKSLCFGTGDSDACRCHLPFGVSSWVPRHVFLTYRDLPPGPLTRLRAANVDKEKLARIAVDHGIHRFLRHKAPKLEEQIADFVKELCQYEYHSNGLLDAPKVLSDIVESLIGAIYLDSKYNQELVWQVFRKLANPLISLESLGKHPVSELLEFGQKTGRIVDISKDGWVKDTKVDVFVDGVLVASATYAQKKEIASNRAAKAALDKLKEMSGQSDVLSAPGEAPEPLDELGRAGALELQ
ncbi:hypothetical protein VPH35_138215 [Triticum aestivum]